MVEFEKIPGCITSKIQRKESPKRSNPIEKGFVQSKRNFGERGFFLKLVPSPRLRKRVISNFNVTGGTQSELNELHN